MSWPRVAPAPTNNRDPKTLPGNVLSQRLGQAVYAPSTRAANVVMGLTVAVGFAALLIAPAIWLAVAVGAGVVVAVLSLLTGRDRSQIISMRKWMSHEVAEGWERETGTPLPRSPEADKLWLESAAAARAPAARRSDALRSVGDFAAARAVLQESPSDDPADVADRACSRFEADFTEYGVADFTPWRDAVAQLDPAAARLYSVEMADYEAVINLRDGREWLPTLQAASLALGPFELPWGIRLIPLIQRLMAVLLAVGAVWVIEQAIRIFGS